jgi:hypothetical protein
MRNLLAILITVAVAVLPMGGAFGSKLKSQDATEISAVGPMHDCCPPSANPCEKTMPDCGSMATCAFKCFAVSRDVSTPLGYSLTCAELLPLISHTICAISESALPVALTTSASISWLTVAVRIPDAADALGRWSRAASSSAMYASFLINSCSIWASVRCCLAFLRFLVSSSAWTVSSPDVGSAVARMQSASVVLVSYKSRALLI